MSKSAQRRRPSPSSQPTGTRRAESPSHSEVRGQCCGLQGPLLASLRAEAPHPLLCSWARQPVFSSWSFLVLRLRREDFLG